MLIAKEFHTFIRILARPPIHYKDHPKWSYGILQKQKKINSEGHEWILEPQGMFQNSKESSQKGRGLNSNESDSVNTFTLYTEFCLELTKL